MTGAPAIIAGLFVYFLWVASHQENGKSGFAAALALSVMMLPIVTRAAQEVVAIVLGSCVKQPWHLVLRSGESCSALCFRRPAPD